MNIQNAEPKTEQELVEMLLETPKELEEPTDDTLEDEVDDSPDEGIIEDEDESEDLEMSDEDEQEGEDEDELAEDNFEEEGVLTISDEDLIEVTIDGEIGFKTIAEAKAALSGEGAIAKRVQEATELRKEAQSAYNHVFEHSQKADHSFQALLTVIQNEFLVSTIQKPSIELKGSNPTAYSQQLEAWQNEQEVLGAKQQLLVDAVQQRQNDVDEIRNSYEQDQAQLTRAAVPALFDPQTGQAYGKEMRDLAMEYGFSEEEILATKDHRHYKMISDLLQFSKARNVNPRKKQGVKDLSTQAAKRPRKLRSSTSAVKRKAVNAAKQQEQLMARARETGKDADIAATLIKQQ